jgi:cyclopropane-fatty-acyl-phospholipid synthase
MNTLSSSLIALKDATINATWGPLVSIARSLCLSVLSKIEIGQLTITDYDGSVTTFGEQTSLKGPVCHLTVHKDTFWLRLALYADMVFQFPSPNPLGRI